jgi:hypothetical protein
MSFRRVVVVVVGSVVASKVISARERIASSGFDGIRVIGAHIEKIAICQ